MPPRQQDMIQLFHYLLDRLHIEDIELFLVQAWVVWNQRNSVMHGGMLKDPGLLNKRAVEYLEKFKQAQKHLTIPMRQSRGNVWRPPSHSLFKLNFNAAIFREYNSSRFGVVIWNKQGEVMAAMAARGPPVSCNKEAKTLVCRKALEFFVDAGFSKLVVEGDNVNFMRVVSSSTMNLSLLGNVIADIQCLLYGLARVSMNLPETQRKLKIHTIGSLMTNLVDGKAQHILISSHSGTSLWEKD